MRCERREIYYLIRILIAAIRKITRSPCLAYSIEEVREVATICERMFRTETHIALNA